MATQGKTKKREASPKVTVVIPTLNAERYMPELLAAIHRQTLQPCEIIVVDSASEDRTAEICGEDSNVRLIHIKREDFDHGGTRDMAVRCSNGDFVVFFSQDALPFDTESLMRLTEQLGKDGIAVCTGRQIARDNASMIEKLIRAYNYPETGNVRSRRNLGQMGIKTFFCSNSFSVYDRKIYLELGGFEYSLMSNEDMLYAAKAINNGYKVAYCADAKVYHSHDHSLMEMFARHFREGYEIERHWNQLGNISLESEGMQMFRAVGRRLLSQGRVLSFVRFGTQCTVKLLGNSTGRFIARRCGLKDRVK